MVIDFALFKRHWFIGTYEYENGFTDYLALLLVCSNLYSLNYGSCFVILFFNLKGQHNFLLLAVFKLKLQQSNSYN